MNADHTAPPKMISAFTALLAGALAQSRAEKTRERVIVSRPENVAGVMIIDEV